MAKEVRFKDEGVSMQGSTMINIIMDKETGVQYLLAIYPNMGSGLTVLVDANGKPLVGKR